MDDPDAVKVRADPARWVDAHGDALYGYAQTRLRRREDAEDAVQETLLAALRGQQDFRGDSAERSWLIGILRHKIVDRIRARAREPAVDPPEGESMDEWFRENGRWLRLPGTWEADPAALTENHEFWAQLRRCFDGLNERHAQVFALRVLDGLEAEEICKQAGITPTNLWVMLHRARTRLRACLEQKWFAPGDRTP